MGVRQKEKEATRNRILEAAVDSLVEVGYAATTTVEVQRRAAVSRGALLHHFATREDLAAAAVGRLVIVNERVARKAFADAPAVLDPIERAMRMLRVAFMAPSMRAELELWAIARTDDALCRVLRGAERKAQRELSRVADQAFGPEVVASSNYPLVFALTVELLRGMAISGVLRGGAHHQEQLLCAWTRIVGDLIGAAALDIASPIAKQPQPVSRREDDKESS